MSLYVSDKRMSPSAFWFLQMKNRIAVACWHILSVLSDIIYKLDNEQRAMAGAFSCTVA